MLREALLVVAEFPKLREGWTGISVRLPMEQHKFPAHLLFRLLLLGEICVLHPGVESSKLDTLQSVTMPFYNNGAFTSCQALGLSV